MNPFRWLSQMFCGPTGHSFEPRWAHGALADWANNDCIYCGKRNPNGHRERDTDSGSEAGTGVYIPVASPYGIASYNPLTGQPSGASPRLEPVVVTEEILAERGWALSQDKDGPVLMSVAHPTRWDGPSLTAHEKPAPGTRSGIYAQRHLEDGYRSASVWGVVALSGTVVEGENGYRAERATVRSLNLRHLPPNAPSYAVGSAFGGLRLDPSVGGGPLTWRHTAFVVADQLARRYQCEVTLDWVPCSELPAEELTV